MSNSNKHAIIQNALYISNDFSGYANLNNKNLHSEDIRVIASYITSPAVTLKQLYLNGNNMIGDDGGEILCAALISSKYCKLEELYLNDTGIGEKTIKLLCDYLLSSASTRLIRLGLEGNEQIGDNEVEKLCTSLALNTTLNCLYLGRCNIGNRGLATLEYLFVNYNSTIIDIDLYGNNEIRYKLGKVIDITENRDDDLLRWYKDCDELEVFIRTPGSFAYDAIERYINDFKTNRSIDVQPYDFYFSIADSMITSSDKYYKDMIEIWQLTEQDIILSLENYIFPFIYSDIIIQQISQKDHDLAFLNKCKEFHGVTQEQFNVSKQLIDTSETPYALAISILKTISLSFTPSRMLCTLMKAAKAVYTFVSTILPGETIGGDLFTDIWVYVVVNAQIPNMITTLYIIEEYGNNDLLCSQAGYYLTVSCLVVNYIKKLTFDKLAPSLQLLNPTSNALSPRSFRDIEPYRRCNIRSIVPPHITSRTDVHQYISKVYRYSWELQITPISSEIPSPVISSFQVLEYLEPKYISKLLQNLKLQNHDIPSHISLHSNSAIIEYLHSIIHLLQYLKLQISDVPSHEIKNHQTLTYLQSIYISQLLQNLKLQKHVIPPHITLHSEIIVYLQTISHLLQHLKLQISDIPSLQITNHQTLIYLQSISELLQQLQLQISEIPPNIKVKQQILEYLQVKVLMKELEFKDHNIPKIFAKSLNAKLAYLKDLKRGKQSTSKLTLMVVGEEGVGKTSLIQQFLAGKWVGDSFDGYDFKDHQKIPRSGITDGIDIHLYQPEGKDFILSIYDFAGQEIYYSTHSFVLSSQAIYLLLFDASKSINSNRIAHWIHTLSAIAPGSSVFLIATHFDAPSALLNLPSTLSQLQSIIDNIQFLSRHDRSLQFITPSYFSSSSSPITLPPSITDVLSSSNLTIWPISISPSSSSPQPSSTCSLSLSELLQSIVIFAEKSIKKSEIPSSWLTFRSILFPQLHDNNNNNSNSSNVGENENDDNDGDEAKAKLYRDGGYQLGIMKEIDICRYGSELVGLEDESVHSFIELLEYWGEIVYIPDHRLKSDRNRNMVLMKSGIIILKPTVLISICKQLISAKKFNASEMHSLSYKLKRKLSSPSSIDLKPHLLNISQLNSNVQSLLSAFNLSSDKISELVDSLIIPVLIDLKLIYPIVLLQRTYIIPAMLRKPTSYSYLLQLKRHPLLSSSFSSSSSKSKLHKSSSSSRKKNKNEDENEDDINTNVVIIERTYEFVYLPDGMFTRLMMDIWNYFSLLPTFSHNLHNNDMFWEDGFIITDHSSSSSSSLDHHSFDYKTSQLCIIQTTNQSKGKDGIARSIHLKLSSPISMIGTILPIIHRAIVNIIIQPLEFETGKNQSHIFCSAITSTYPNDPPRIYEYNDCFKAILQFTNDDSVPPSDLLPFLIPEYFYVSFENQKIEGNDQFLSSSSLLPSLLPSSYSRYYDDVHEVKALKSGEGGDVWYGYWHNQFEVAIKKPKPHEIPAILNEIHILKTLHHRSILKLLDVYRFQSTSSQSLSNNSSISLAIITEYCREGDLKGLVQQHKERLHPIIVSCIIRDIAEGISYLHNHSPPIVHSDLHSGNIFIKSLKLIKGEVCAVIGDVGFARVADPLTRSAGSKSMIDDVRSFMFIIDELFFLLPSSNNDNNNNDGCCDDDGDDLEILCKLVIAKLRQIQSIVMDREFRIDTIEIANIISSDIIAPFFIMNKINDNNNDDDDDNIRLHTSLSPHINYYNHHHNYMQRKNEYEAVITQILLPSPNFSIIKNLVNRHYNQQNAETLLLKCISYLSLYRTTGSFASPSLFSNHRMKTNILTHTLTPSLRNNNVHSTSTIPSSTLIVNNEYWRIICRYVIPVIGNAIEHNVFTIDHLKELDEMEYYYDSNGDFEFGLTLFHYACKSANLFFVEKLFPKSCLDINQRTYLPSGSAAIHLAISSLKHRSNTNGIDRTRKLLDFLIRSQHANINLQDNKGETAIFKAAMEGSYPLVVHLLNYPQSVDIHILSHENISAIIAAARYSPRRIESNLCIKALLQMGSEYSSSLRGGGVISCDELKRIQCVACDLIHDPSSSFARFPHSTHAIQSWIVT